VRLALLVAAGCGGSSIGEPCSQSDPCSDDAVCDFTAPGGPVCISADGDSDGDGLTNDKDFCQHAIGGAYDEDGDGIGDDCDHCPIAPPRAAADADGDAVDSPCDPEPSEPGDEIVFFDGFATGLAAEWKPTTAAAWQGGAGEVKVDLSAVTTQDYLQHAVVAKTNLAIEAGYRVDRVENSAARHLVAVYATDPRPAGVAHMQCGVSRADVGVSDLVVVETNTGTMGMPSSEPALLTSKLYRTGAYASGTVAGCSVIAGNTPLGSVQSSITAESMPSIALTAHAVSVRFQYVLVIGRD
jgi:hypothetical protein